MNAIWSFMKRNYKIIGVVAILSIALLSFFPLKEKNDPEKDKMLIELLTFIVEKGHYDPKDIDDNFSKGVYTEYIMGLDPSKRIFLQSDIDEFAKYETLLDDQIKNKDLSFFDLTYSRLMQRTKESEAFYKEILDKPFDYTIDEEINTDYEKTPYAANKTELKDRWRKQIKLSTLSSLNDKLKYEEDKKNGVFEKANDSLTASEKKRAEKAKKDKEGPKSYEELEKETRESSLKSLNELYSFMKDLNRDDYFSIYLNAIAEGFDPHTNYMAPDDKEKFDVSMSGKFFGIGARLQKKNDFTEITELISGGPAWRGKELEAGDVVMKVAQGDAEPVDIVGMRLDDVVKKIKGPKDTEVRLTVKKSDGTIKVISIIRDEVEIEETYAKSSVVEKDGKKYGIIYLPKFYINFENKDDRDAAKDVAIEVERLKQEGVQGIVMDVRDNGGGSLRTVVDIAGLFIKEGPIVQVKTTGKNKEVLSDKDSRIQWDGPLVVMINNFSASASEILAAAIQDYKRGVIIGSKQSYGKGTVQNVYGLNDFIRNSSVGDLGALKTTTQKFYRINGGSTQLKGVSSDVNMPDRFSHIEIGERDMKNAMPWDKIDAAKFEPWKIENYDAVIANSKNRLAKNPQFQLIDENAKWISKRRDENVYSLQLDKFKKEQENLDAEAKKYKPISDYKNKLEFKSLPNEMAMMEKDSLFKEKRVRWHESLSKDVYVEEALNVLSDMQSKNVVKAKLPSKAKKGKLVGSL
ncbi:carboxyl-terminal processing protease [Flavobacterium arsenatis]|uniref:Carboxyl-terminal processing protease n=1 Tax=Flavobacterium arsenatis TaxID=1484332 RepID=A0ABU1TK82_9FLAO|nr:carboxy terminal-processing peptidase [Flavobacterium arsenatis]MDR6966390.1 carboxyl-terminal processing protease [Flavobacterium arsenatis]